MHACPRDDGPLKIFTSEHGPSSRCTRCSGLWLSGLVVIRHVGEIPRPSHVRRAGQETGLRCPADGASLVAVRHHHVEIDVCPACSGVWLDSGELEHLRRAHRAPVRCDVAGDVVEVVGEPFGQAAGDAAFDAVGSVLEAIGEVFSALF